MLHLRRGWFSVATMAIFIVVALAVLTRVSYLLGTRPSTSDANGHLQDTSSASLPPLGGLGAIPLPPSL